MINTFIGVEVPWAPDHIRAIAELDPPKGAVVSTLPVGNGMERVHVEYMMPLVNMDWELDVTHGAN